MLRQKEKEPLIANESIELTQEVISLVQKLRLAFKDIIGNMSKEMFKAFEDLEGYSVKLIDYAEDPNAEINDNKKLLLEKWRYFIKNAFLTELQQKDIIFRDLDLDKQLISIRYKQFSALFHPDKNRDNLIYSNEDALLIMKLLNLKRDKTFFNSASASNEMEQGEACLQKYYSYKDSPLVELQENSKLQVQQAISHFKNVIKAIDDEIWRSYQPGNECLAIQISVREKIADCYGVLSQYFHAQLYIIGAIRIAERSYELENKRGRLSELQSKLRSFKKTILENRQNINDENQAAQNEESQLLERRKDNAPLNASTDIISINNYKNEMGDAVRQYLSVIPEKSLVQYNIQPHLISQNQIYKAAHYAVGGTIQILGGLGGGGIVTAGAIPLLTATTLSITGTSALFGPVGWIVGGGFLIAAGIFTGIVIIKKGASISNIVEIQKEINQAIEDAFQLYTEGKYQALIERLSGREHFKYGSPLIFFDRDTLDYPIRIEKTKGTNAIDTIDYLLNNGVRPDGIAFLLNIVAEVLLSKRINARSPDCMQLGAALHILHVLISNERMIKYAENLDSNHREILIENNGNVDDLEDTTWRGIKNAYYSIMNKNDQIILSSYVRDFKVMPIARRLDEMKHAARINYAMGLIMHDSADSLTVASTYLQEVRSYYSASQYEGVINEKLEIVNDLMIAFGMNPKKEEELSDEKLLESTCWKLHYEFLMMSAKGVASPYEPRIKEALLSLTNDNKKNSQIYAILMFDWLRVALLSKGWNDVAIVLGMIAEDLPGREYRFEEVFHPGYVTLIDIYENWVTKDEGMTSETKRYLLSSLKKLGHEHIENIIKTMSQMVGNRRIQLGNHVKIESLRDVLGSIFNGSITPFIASLIKPVFLELPVSRQLKAIYECELDLANKDNATMLSNLSKRCHDAYFASLKDLIVKMAFLEEDKIEEYYNIIKEKMLNKGLVSPVDDERKDVFKEGMAEIRKLSKSDFDFTKDNYYSNLIKDCVKDEKKKSVEYYKRGADRLKALFPEDFREFQEASIKASKQGLFGSSESSSLRESLKSKVIGQTYALDIVANTLISQRQNKEGGKSPAFLCVGPTGVGKTELAKAISDVISPLELKSGESKPRLVAFNMEKYSNEHTASSIIGAPLGFVGSSDEPVFVQKIKPFAEPGSEPGTFIVKHVVILLDEFDRAHSKVMEAFMGLLDESFMEFTFTKEKDRTNVKQIYYFRDCIIIATSNLLAHQIKNDFACNLPSEKICDNFKALLTVNPHLLKPEMLGRFKVVPFGPVKRGEEFQKIVEIYLNTLIREYEHKFDIKMSIEKEDKKLIIEAIESEHYGDGTSIRTFKKDFKIDLESIFSKLNAKHLSDNQYEAILKFNRETQRVEIRFQYDNIGSLIVVEEDQSNHRFCLTSNKMGLHLGL